MSNELIRDDLQPDTYAPLPPFTINPDGSATYDDFQTVPESWKAFPGATNVINFGGGFQPLQYRKESQVTVHLRGLGDISGVNLNTPGGADPIIIFTVGTLPVGYRPSSNRMFPCPTSFVNTLGNTIRATNRLDVLSTGAVRIVIVATTNIPDGSFQFFSMEALYETD